MDNTFWIIVCATLAAITGVLLCSVAKDIGTSRRARQYSLFYLLILGWQICDAVFFMLSDHGRLRVVMDMKLGFEGFLVVVLFFVMTTFYRVSRHFPRWLPPAMCLVPAITMILAVTTNYHSLLTQRFFVEATAPTNVVLNVRGGWYYVHMAYCLLLVGAMAVIIIGRYQGMPKEYRGGTGPIAAGFLCLVVGCSLEFSRAEKSMVDLVMVAATIGGVMFFLAIVLNGRTDYLQIERREVFNFLDEAVFVLNTEGRVLDMNKAALAWQASLEEDCEGKDFDGFLRQLLDSGKLISKPAEIEEEKDAEYFAIARYMLIYRMKKWSIPAENGQTDGVYISMQNVTRNRLTIERLMSTAGVDALTGLYNRYGYQSLLRSLDQEENLPLALIMGDVNGLKHINDTYGHDEGDRFLMAVSRAIASCCGEGCHGARIGGDEFVVVCTHCDRPAGLRLMEDIHQALAGVEGLAEQPTISLGLAIKTQPEENINLLADQADIKMYGRKASIK